MLEIEMIIKDKRIMEYAIKIFDDHPRYGGLSEKVVKYTFSQCKKNTDFEEVRVKVITLCSLYGAGWFNIDDMANKIFKIADLDKCLDNGCLSAVESIRYGIKKKEKGRRGDYVFATKYCCLHNQNAYPIYDRLVSGLLFEINNKSCTLVEELEKGEQMHDYSVYKQLIDSFRNKLEMNNYNYRTIDKGLYMIAWYYKNDPWVIRKLDCFLAVNGII